jgi:hypothetical protein
MRAGAPVRSHGAARTVVYDRAMDSLYFADVVVGERILVGR